MRSPLKSLGILLGEMDFLWLLSLSWQPDPSGLGGLRGDQVVDQGRATFSRSPEGTERYFFPIKIPPKQQKGVKLCRKYNNEAKSIK